MRHRQFRRGLARGSGRFGVSEGRTVEQARGDRDRHPRVGRTGGARQARRARAARAAGAAVALLVASVAGYPPLSARTAAPVPPDVVLVVVDALRADRLSLYGYGRPTTPALERRRSELRWFTDATAASTQTVPSVAALLTGRPPRLHWIQYDPATNSFPPYGESPRFDTRFVTLSETFGEAGYDTRAIVGNPWLTEATRFDRGFSKFEGWKIWDRNGVNDDEAMVVAAKAYLSAPSKRPRFLYLHLMGVHNPYDKGHRQFVRGTGVVRYLNGRVEASREDTDYMSDLYDSNVAFVDGLLGGLIDRLTAPSGNRPALVCVVGDHGDEFQEHGGFGHGTTVYHELARVPVLFWGPGIVTRYGPSAYPLELPDVRAILLALAGVSPNRLDGLVSKRASEPAFPSPSFRSIELYHEKAVYQKPWKYIVTTSPFGERLFNLQKDPAEKVDRSAAEPRVLARLRAVAQGWWPDIAYPQPATAGSR